MRTNIFFEPFVRSRRSNKWMSHRKIEIHSGFTLMELVIVVAIMSVIAVVAVSRVGRVGTAAQRIAAESDLKALREAFVDEETGYLRDFRGIPGFSLGFLRLANLLVPTNLYVRLSEETDSTRTPGTRVDDGWAANRGCAKPATFFQWNADAGRGWRGPYVKKSVSSFPGRADVRFADDETFDARGFYPTVAQLDLPRDILNGREGCSVYGFPGEPALLDPWGNPYVLQIPPPQAFDGVTTNLSDEVRFRYARVVSAGPDGRLDTPCFDSNGTNWWATSWGERKRRLVRQAGLIDGDDRLARGDDLVLFLLRNDVDEGEEQ